MNKRALPKCVLYDWSDSDENIAEGRILSSDPDDLVNNCRLGPTDLKVLVETATKPDAFLWRPASNMFTVEEAVGQIIAWPASKCVLVDKNIQIEDIAPLVNFSFQLEPYYLIDRIMINILIQFLF